MQEEVELEKITETIQQGWDQMKDFCDLLDQNIIRKSVF